MKKLISILSVFLLFACGKSMNEEQIVTSVTEINKGRFRVTTNGWYEFHTNETCFRVGDTLKFAKKNKKTENELQ